MPAARHLPSRFAPGAAVCTQIPLPTPPPSRIPPHSHGRLHPQMTDAAKLPRFAPSRPAVHLQSFAVPGSRALRTSPKNLSRAELGSLPQTGTNKRPATDYPSLCCTPLLRTLPAPKSIQSRIPLPPAQIDAAADLVKVLPPGTNVGRLQSSQIL